MVPTQATIRVHGMSCDNCARTVREALEKTEGVFSADVALEEGRAIVTYDASVVPGHALLSALDAAGYKGELPDEAPPAH